MLVAAAFAGVAIWLSAIVAREWLDEKRLSNRVKDIVELINAPAEAAFQARVDAVRFFVSDHSQHEPDAAFRALNGDPVAFADRIIAHARDASVPRVHMECSTRANLMGRILRSMGYETRTIAVFRTRGEARSHTFLDVLNPETGAWESQDPDFDVYWRNKSTKARVSLAEVAERLDDVEPCGRSACGWGHVSREGYPVEMLTEYLDILSVTQKEKNVRYSVYTGRADLSRTFAWAGKTGTFCEVNEKRCKDGFFRSASAPVQQQPPIN